MSEGGVLVFPQSQHPVVIAAFMPLTYDTVAMCQRACRQDVIATFRLGYGCVFACPWSDIWSSLWLNCRASRNMVVIAAQRTSWSEAYIAVSWPFF
eukprot:3133406-Amphidinium_carterae.1